MLALEHVAYIKYSTYLNCQKKMFNGKVRGDLYALLAWEKEYK